MKRVAIVGAGESGLPSIKACKEVGLEPVCFEMTFDLGGLWRYKEKVEGGISHTRRSTIMNTSKEMTCYSDFPVPEDYPNFMHTSHVWQYLHLYAEHFDLLKHIQFCVSVTSITQERDEDGDQPTGRWCLQLHNTQAQHTWTDTFDGLMLCTGITSKRMTPSIPGLDDFQGTILHTQEIQDLGAFHGKRVVVVGGGDSALDAAVDLSPTAEQVWLSIRRGAWVLGSISSDGLPWDLLQNRRITNCLASLLPACLYDDLMERKVNRRFNHAMYGIQPEHRFSAAKPPVNDDLPNCIANGRIIIKPDIECITTTGLCFVDGTLLDEIDAIIFGTGFQIKFPYLEKGVVNVENSEIELYKLVFPPHLGHATLAVIGCVQPLGATLPVAEMQARWATMVFKGERKLPGKAEMVKEIQKRRQKIHQRYVRSQRHEIQVDYINYTDDIAKCVGCKPRIGWMFLNEPSLAVHCLFGPAVSSQWRLHGPGAWEGARQCIKTVCQRVEQPFKTRQVPKPAHTNITDRKRSLLLLATAGIAVAISWMAFKF